MSIIKFYNVDRFYKKNKANILKITDKVFSTGIVLEGDFVKETEEYLCKITNRKYCCLVGSCTDALFFSLIASGIKKGDEVLVPVLSFVASASAVKRAGATPVFVDVDNNGAIDLQKAKKSITKNTKAIIIVHLYGKMMNVIEVEKFSKKHNLKVIEDAAQAIGSSYNNIPAGKTGITSCFSFDPSKVVNAFGTGGAVLTDSDEIIEKIKILQVQGKIANSKVTKIISRNSRISGLQAQIVLYQLKSLDKTIKKRNQIAHCYNSVLNLSTNCKTLNLTNNEIWNYHKYPIFTKERDNLKKHLLINNIENAIHYTKLLNKYSIFKQNNNIYKNASILSETELSLPIYPELSNTEIDYICNTLIKFFKL